ncbi:MAG TPA: class I SAM-dependent methyltransferase [candidate division Zixibacteria bacterium]|nr:class I SAM-dependent methyltransferase [candidate division Zixibacteria bacterium]
MQLDEIKKHWETAGKAIGLDDPMPVTSRDPFMGQLERRYILQHLPSNGRVLEIGCGDALHAPLYAARSHEYHGLDVAASLLALAETRLSGSDLNNWTLHCASVLDIDKRFEPGSFDCIISQRCIINLPTWSDQKEALNKICSLLRPGGKFLLSEGFTGELANLNQLRNEMGLPPINVVEYNRFMDRGEFETEVGCQFSVEAFCHYGLYLYLSRVFHPLAVFPDQPQHLSPMNEAAMKLSMQGEVDQYSSLSYNLFYSLKKKT